MAVRQPFLHELTGVLSAPVQAWSGADGQIRRSGVQGMYCADTRIINSAVLTVNGEEPESIGVASDHGVTVTFESLIRNLGDEGADPLVSLSRRRSVSTTVMSEEIVLRSDLAHDVVAVVVLDIGCDFSAMDSIRAGSFSREMTPIRVGDGWRVDDGSVVAEISAPGAVAEAVGGALVIRWTVNVPAHVSASASWAIKATDSQAPFTASKVVALAPPRVQAQDRRLAALADRAFADLQGLRMSSVNSPSDTFLAAGAPWYFTLFGRDSLISARMMIPVDPTIAAGTLRTLADLQGTKNDPDTAEQPGKILHEVRRNELHMPGDAINTDVWLPPVYYGTVDATLLWVSLLHDAWKWGMPEPEVRALLGNLEAAMTWLKDWADADGDGFLEYIDASGHGLANQGWKDSGDSIRWQNGSLATGPIALAEVQGYAYEAAIHAADMFDAFGHSGGPQWREYAAKLASQFRESFWCEDELGPYPAIALDKDNRAVNGVASNMGHLLGTGLLSADEEDVVAARLMHPSMFSGFGIRTLDTSNRGYWPLRYHAGSVWTHDSALALEGLAKSGHADDAARISSGLLDAAEFFDYRLPELFSGHSVNEGGPMPYPASCRPQAWAAASVVPMILATLRLTPQGPGQLPTAADHVPTPFGAFTVEGLRIGGEVFNVHVDQYGKPTVAFASYGPSQHAE